MQVYMIEPLLSHCRSQVSLDAT